MTDFNLPMLASEIKYVTLQELLTSGKYVAEQKIDGKRMMIVVNDMEPFAHNRNGEQIEFPPSLVKDFTNKNFKGVWIFDGELLGDKFYLFDCMTVSGTEISHKPYSYRRDFIEKLHSKWKPTNVILVPAATDNNEAFFERCRDAGVEGVVFKMNDSTYKYSKRSPNWVKFKFVKTCDVIVTELEREGKERSVGISVYDNSDRVSVGAVKIPDDLVDVIQLDDIIEVKYLYASDSDRLVQPQFLRVRDDKEAIDCTLDQLVYTNREVLDT